MSNSMIFGGHFENMQIRPLRRHFSACQHWFSDSAYQITPNQPVGLLVNFSDFFPDYPYIYRYRYRQKVICQKPAVQHSVSHAPGQYNHDKRLKSVSERTSLYLKVSGGVDRSGSGALTTRFAIYFKYAAPALQAVQR